MNPDGSGQTRLTSFPSSSNVNIGLVWSPDSQRLAFESNAPPAIRAVQIFVMNADGSVMLRLTGP